LIGAIFKGEIGMRSGISKDKLEYRSMMGRLSRIKLK
jgi:hypothetical protein